MITFQNYNLLQNVLKQLVRFKGGRYVGPIIRDNTDIISALIDLGINHTQASDLLIKLKPYLVPFNKENNTYRFSLKPRLNQTTNTLYSVEKYLLYIRTNYGFWISNNGDFISVSSPSGHEKALLDKGIFSKTTEPRHVALEHKWIRGVFQRRQGVIHTIFIESKYPLSDVQKKTLKNIVIEAKRDNPNVIVIGDGFYQGKTINILLGEKKIILNNFK